LPTLPVPEPKNQQWKKILDLAGLCEKKGRFKKQTRKPRDEPPSNAFSSTHIKTAKYLL